MAKMLPISFFNRPSEIVAKELIGKVLVYKKDGKMFRYVINETEAYVSAEDEACHAFKGRTKRTEVLYESPGTIYMYLIYGMYWMLNIVTLAKGVPAAVLIRGMDKFDGPGKLTRHLAITGEFNTLLLGIKTGLWVEEGETNVKIVATPRIGIDYAGEPWKSAPLRFVRDPRTKNES